MSEDTTYNGWKNYPTWAVNLWLTNDQDEYEAWMRTVDDAYRHSDTPRVYVADMLKEAHEEGAETRETNNRTGASVYANLLGYALDCVDWFEIADGLIAAQAEISV